jgi:hypothetical protein
LFRELLRQQPFDLPNVDWKAVPVGLIWFKDLILTQHWLTVEQLLQESKRSEACDTYEQVVRWNNKNYLVNGHHRVLKKWIQGEVGSVMRILSAWVCAVCGKANPDDWNKCPSCGNNK